jgi:hypothetical protein
MRHAGLAQEVQATAGLGRHRGRPWRRRRSGAGDLHTDELFGQIIRHTGVDLSWGLHLIDVDHAMGSLIRVVRRQADTYIGDHS